MQIDDIKMIKEDILRLIQVTEDLKWEIKILKKVLKEKSSSSPKKCSCCE